MTFVGRGTRLDMKRLAILLLLVQLGVAVSAQDTVQPTANDAFEREALVREQQLVVLKDRIRSQHRRINAQCSDEGVADKSRARFLKNIYYAYLSVFNHYNVASSDSSPEFFNQLLELDSLQRHISDSIIGTDSYLARIDGFKNTLKLKAGKNHADVYKSYVRSFQPPNIPINFTNVDEYRQYVRQHLEVIKIQNLYLDCIEWLDRIDANSGSIIAMLGNTGHATPYKNILSATNFVPAFSTDAGGMQFVEKLQEFEAIQQEYLKTESRIRELEGMADSIYREGRRYSDLTAAFRTVQHGTDVYPTFRNREELDVYNRKLADYKTVARQYTQLIRLRDTIAINENITDHSSRTLRDGQRTLKRYTKWTPDFSTPQEGEKFIENIYGLIAMQQECIAINDNIVTQGVYEKEILGLTKNYTYIRRAYNTMLKSYTYKGSIATRENLRIYGDLQRQAVEMQETLIEYIKRNPMELERQMRAQRDVRGYKSVINVK